jgi:NADP-dependent 3-hydroxy acid dehydrogenase YdfG
VGEGTLVNISSVLGTKVRTTAGAYAATKYAVEALSEALRMELARTNVRITCIEPGLVRSGLHRHLDIHPAESMGIEPLTPEDIADQVLHVLQQPANVRIPRLMVLPKDHEI